GTVSKELTVTVTVNDPSVTVTATPASFTGTAGTELNSANCKAAVSVTPGSSENWSWTVNGETGKSTVDGVTATLTGSGDSVTLTLSGTPTEVRTYEFTVRAAAGSKANEAKVTLNVSTLSAITVTATPSSFTGTAGTELNSANCKAAVTAEPSGLNYVWTVDGKESVEKDGITAALTGSGNTVSLAFSGTPSAAGEYKFRVAAASNGVTGSQDITVTVYNPAVGFESADQALAATVQQNLTNLLDVPAGTTVHTDLKGVTFDDPNAFLIKVTKKWESNKNCAVIANISPLSVAEPGVYLMKLNMSDDKRLQMKNSFNVDYHVELSSDIAAGSVESSVVKIAAEAASDGSHGVLVDKDGNRLGTYYDGGDLHLLVCLNTADTWYAQYLTMDQSYSLPTSNKGSGCEHGCNSGFVGMSAAALLVLFFAPSGNKRKGKK
nr:hypothetical protein [Fretibacterium sp.]